MIKNRYLLLGLLLVLVFTTLQISKNSRNHGDNLVLSPTNMVTDKNVSDNLMARIDVTMSPNLSPVRSFIKGYSPTPVSVGPDLSPSPMVTSSHLPIISSSPSPSIKPTLSPSILPNQTQVPVLSPTPMITRTSAPIALKDDYGYSSGSSGSSVVFNEIGWMGTEASSSDEWVELYNTTNSLIDLTGWILKSETDGSPNIVLSGTVNPGGYFLIERTDESTINDMKADMVSSFGKGGLNNAGEKLTLISKDGVIKDFVDCSGGWFFGSVSGKYSMERRKESEMSSAADSWKNNDGIRINGYDKLGGTINGTPRQENS